MELLGKPNNQQCNSRLWFEVCGLACEVRLITEPPDVFHLKLCVFPKLNSLQYGADSGSTAFEWFSTALDYWGFHSPHLRDEFCVGTNCKLFQSTSPLPDRLVAWLWFFKQGDHLLVFLLAALLCRYLHLRLRNHVGTHGGVKEVWRHYAGRDESFWMEELKREKLNFRKYLSWTTLLSACSNYSKDNRPTTN